MSRFSSETHAWLDQQYPERVAEREQRAARRRAVETASTVNGDGLLAFAAGDYAAALSLLEKAAELWASLGDRTYEARTALAKAITCKERIQCPTLFP